MENKNYRLLIRNLRERKYEQFILQKNNDNIEFAKIRESIRIQEKTKPDNR